jgi:hypothetical protein
MKVWQR